MNARDTSYPSFGCVTDDSQFGTIYYSCQLGISVFVNTETEGFYSAWAGLPDEHDDAKHFHGATFDGAVEAVIDGWQSQPGIPPFLKGARVTGSGVGRTAEWPPQTGTVTGRVGNTSVEVRWDGTHFTAEEMEIAELQLIATEQ